MLVVDDISIERQILSTLFENEYTVLEADDGTAALSVLESNEVDIVILDIIMPGMNGLELLKQIKQNSKYQNISIIVCTEASDTETEKQAMELGADNFIHKPYNPSVVKYCVKNLVDTHIRKKIILEKSYRETVRRFHAFMEVVQDGVAVITKTDKYRVTYANDRLIAMFGYTRREAVCLQDSDALLFVSEDSREQFGSILEDTSICQRETCCISVLHKDGRPIHAKVNVKMMLKDGGTKQYYVIVKNDDETREREAVLEKEINAYRIRVRRDPLTGIYNQETFFLETKKLLEQNPKVQFVIGEWNIDRFKAVNELFGSRIGDRLICAFADYLRNTYTGQCTYGRLEADHFVTCCPQSMLEEHAAEIADLLGGHLIWHTLNCPISMHAGFYRVESSEFDVPIMCDRAGMALQLVKDRYMQRYMYFSSKMRDVLLKEQEMMRDVEQALDEKQFFVMYQPIIDVKTKRIIAAEALVRWRKANGEVVPPGEFIPIFERNGFISRLDMYVWEQVCIFQSKRMEAGEKMIPISVNLSRIDFYNADLYNNIRSLIQKYNLEPSYLKLEITESAYMDQPQELMETIRQFQKNGIKVLMDDFGSGFSSLNMLKDVSVDMLKIDMRFMESLETSDRAGNILFSIIQMAKSVHMEVIAEGVETVNQYELLVSMNCDGVQGYYFFRPLMADELRDRLNEEAKAEETEDIKKHQSILIVDDVEQERDLLAKIISDDYDTFFAAGVDEAVEILKKEFARISLVISDIVMPKKDGFELLKVMKELAFFDEIPVLMVTAYGEYENIEKSISLGALDVVTKPYDAAILKKRLSNILKISEREKIKREIYSLRENVVLRKQLDSLLEDSFAGICRVQFSDDENFTIEDIPYVNERFLFLHHMLKKEAAEKKTLSELLNDTVESDLRVFLSEIKAAIDGCQKNMQGNYRIKWDDMTFRETLTNITFRYEQNSIIMDMVLIENKSHIDAQLDQTVKLFYEQIGKQIGLEIWRYYPSSDMIEYYTKSKDGTYVKKVIPNGKQNTVQGKLFFNVDIDSIDRIYKRILAGESQVQEEFRIKDPENPDEGYRWIRLTLVKIEEPGTLHEIILGMSADITGEQKGKERKWREQQYKMIFSADADFFVEADLTENSFVSENCIKQFERLGIYDMVTYDVLVDAILKTVGVEDMEHCRSMLDRKNLLEWYQEGEREVKFDFLGNANDANMYEWYCSDMFLVKNSEDAHIYVSWQIKNINHEKQRMNNIQSLAERDSVTGLYNRIMLEKSMDIILAAQEHRSKLYAFMMVDIDNFKEVNDNFGHDFGDNVLRAFGKLLTQTFRSTDIVSRLGGDEFAVFIPRATSQEQIIKRVEEVCEKSYTKLNNQGKDIP